MCTCTVVQTSSETKSDGLLLSLLLLSFFLSCMIMFVRVSFIIISIDLTGGHQFLLSSLFFNWLAKEGSMNDFAFLSKQSCAPVSWCVHWHYAINCSSALSDFKVNPHHSFVYAFHRCERVSVQWWDRLNSCSLSPFPSVGIWLELERLEFHVNIFILYTSTSINCLIIRKVRSKARSFVRPLMMSMTDSLRCALTFRLTSRQ